MKAKIEWYQEVLELEPGSKVFFPLAKLLGRSGEREEAVRVLRQGLVRHPEYIEARLLLVQLLRESGDATSCERELVEITNVFAEYPGFWEAWSEHSPADDVACALSFLVAALRSPGLTLRDVFAAGLRTMGGSGDVGKVIPPRSSSPAAAPVATELTAVPTFEPALEPVLSDVPAPATFEPEPSLSPSEPAAAVAAQSASEPAPVPAAIPDEDESDESGGADNDVPTVRTRSMAEILAEQGDIEGAVAIYRELLASAAPGPEADKLRDRLAALTGRLGATLPASPDGAEDELKVEPEAKPEAGLEEAADVLEIEFPELDAVELEEDLEPAVPADERFDENIEDAGPVAAGAEAASDALAEEAPANKASDEAPSRMKDMLEMLAQRLDARAQK